MNHLDHALLKEITVAAFHMAAEGVVAAKVGCSDENIGPVAGALVQAALDDKLVAQALLNRDID